MIVDINEQAANEVHEDLLTIYADLQEIAVHERVSNEARSRAISRLCRVSQSLDSMGVKHSAYQPKECSHGG